MEYSNSSLINYTKLSPNYTKGRKTINRITPHHTAGVNPTAMNIANQFASVERGASCNYGIGNDGSAALIVEEKNRAWTSSNRTNDDMAITFEISNSINGEPWTISDKAYAKFIDIAVDICQRYGVHEVFNIEKELAKVAWSERGNFANNYPVPAGKILLTQHNYFTATQCPGTFIKQHFDQMCADINARLSGAIPPITPVPPVTPTPQPTTEVAKPTLRKGDTGAEVKKLQKNLNNFGYHLSEDGDFGGKTFDAVKGFQALTDLDADGIYGPMSAAKMAEKLKK